MHAREIHIRPVVNGFVVQVGCQSVVVDSVAKLAAEIAAYYTDPRATEARYLKAAVNNPGILDAPTPVSERAIAPEPLRAGCGSVTNTSTEAVGRRPY